MAIKSPYLASEDSAVERRSRGLYRFLVASPIALLLIVAFVAHLPRPAYRHPASDRAYDEKVLAYRDRVAAVQSLRPFAERTGKEEAIEREAQKWVDGYANGQLQPVTSAVFEDHFRDGVRSEIVRAGLDLAGGVLQGAETSKFANAPDRAVRQATLAAETAFGLRGFDIQAHLQCTLLMRRCSGMMLEIWPNVSDATKEAVRPRLRRLLADPAEIEKLGGIEEAQLADYLRRQKLTDLDGVGGGRRPRRNASVQIRTPMPNVKPATENGRPTALELQNEDNPELRAAERGVGASNLRIQKLLGEAAELKPADPARAEAP